MTALVDLHRSRAVEVAAMENLLNTAEGEHRRLTDTEQSDFDERRTAIAALDAQITRGVAMEESTPHGALRSLLAVPTKLSDAVPHDIVRQIDTAGRCSFELKQSLRMLAKAIIGENLPPPNVSVAAAPSWRLLDGYISPPSLLSLLPRESVSGSAIIQNVITYAPPNNAGNHAAVVPEAQLKPESELTCTPSTVAFVTYAHWVRCTRQVLSDVPALRNLLDSILTRGLMAKVDAALLAGLTTAGTAVTPPAGANGIDGAYMAAAQLACMGGTGITVLVNCLDLAAASIAKISNGAYLGRPPDFAGRIVPSPIVPAGTFVAFASEAAFVAERESVGVVAGVADDDFVKNLVRLLAEWRGVLVLSMPQFILNGTMGGAVTEPEQQMARHAGAPRRT